jgi:hypothetical protein
MPTVNIIFYIFFRMPLRLDLLRHLTPEEGFERPGATQTQGRRAEITISPTGPAEF